MKTSETFIKFLSFFIPYSKWRKAFRKYCKQSIEPTLYKKNRALYNIGEFSYLGLNTFIKNKEESVIGKYGYIFRCSC